MRTTDDSYLQQQNLLRFLLKIMRLKGSKASEQGVTLVECIVAILVAGITLALMAPIILLSVGTRLQNYRAEQAMTLAQAEVDRMRALISRGVDQDDSHLPPKIAGSFSSSAVDPPTAIVASYASDTNQAREIDIDQDSQTDFFIQTFRDEGESFDTGQLNNQLAIFRMGVRVYSMAARDTLEANQLASDSAPLLLTNSIGYQQTQPLAALYTEVSRSDIDLSLVKLRCHLDPSSCSSTSP